MNHRTFLLRLWALLLLALGLVASASAQPRDEGQYQILQALYGTARHNIDVTPRLRELARSDRTVRMGNDTFGTDPDPGQPKTLRIYARSRDGQTRVFDYPEGDIVDGSRYTGWSGGNFGDSGFRGGWQAAAGGAPEAPRGHDEGEYRILQALYGTARTNVDVTARLRELARQDRSFRMGNDTFGTDPDPGHVKMLRIYARGRDGQTRVFDYPENGVVDGSQFSGWSRGNFGESGYRGGWHAQGADNEHRPGGRDAGEYRILQALYGTARRNVDVTDQLRAMARSDQEMRVTRQAFNVDPDPGQPKTLRIYARGRDEQVRLFEFRQGSVVDGSHFRGWRGGEWARAGDYRGNWNGELRGRPAAHPTLQIVSATWGSGSRKQDVTARLRSQIHNGRIEALVDNDLAGGDPAPGAQKTLWVTYTVDGRTQQARVDERGQLSIP